MSMTYLPGRRPLRDCVGGLAQLIAYADAGDDSAEADLWLRYQEDERLHPGNQVMTYHPYGRPRRKTDLRTDNPLPAREES